MTTPLRPLLLAVALALSMVTAMPARAEEPDLSDARTGGASDRLWDWTTSKDPPRVLATLLQGTPKPAGLLVCVEPTALAARFYRRMAERPVPDELPATGLWMVGRGATPLKTTKRGELAHALQTERTVKRTPREPMLAMLAKAVKHAELTLPAPRHVLLVTRRFDPDRAHLETLIHQAQAAACSISFVCPEAPFADNARVLLKSKRLAGEAPEEEVPFDFDRNLAGLWLARVGWTKAHQDKIPHDVRGDPWRMQPLVRGLGYGLVPSGFSAFPISRLAHATGGRVYLHSYTPPREARCTFRMDAAAYRRLAPSVAARRPYRAWRGDDRVASLYDRALTILRTAPGVLVRDVRRARADGSVKGVKPLPTHFRSNADLSKGLRLAARKEALVRKALLVLGRLDSVTGEPDHDHRFRAHATLLRAWLHRAHFHLRQYELTLRSIRAENRLASGVVVSIGPRVLWKLCFGIRGAGQRNLDPRPGPDVEALRDAVVESALIVGRRYRNTPWEAASKLGFLVSYVPLYNDTRARGPAPARRDPPPPPVTPRDDQPADPPATPPTKPRPSTTPTPKPTKPATPKPADPPAEEPPPSRPAVGGSGNGGAVTGD